MFLPVSCLSTNLDMIDRSDVNVVAFSISATGTEIINCELNGTVSIDNVIINVSIFSVLNNST